MKSKTSIKIAVVGVGNCFSALYQGFEYYKTNKSEIVPGIMFGDIGGYTPTDMEVVGALRGPSAWTQKTPPQQMMYADAKAECESFAKREITATVKKSK